MSTVRVALIMAGGSGDRFWPLSRPDKPKQLLCLTDPRRSLLQVAVERLLPIFPAERIYVVTSRALEPPLREALPAIPGANVIAEPARRNTAGCLCYAAAVLKHRLGGERVTMAVVTADHRVGDEARFRQTLSGALAVAEGSGALVTLGVRPTHADAGFGYIEPETLPCHVAGETPGPAVFPVTRFIEKPDAATARRLIADGRHLWNSGMFFWELAAFLRELRSAQPAMADAVDAMVAGLGGGDAAAVEAAFARLPDLSIDHALMERSRRVLVMPADFDWEDVGSWDALERVWPRDAAGNVSLGDPVLVDCRDSIVVNEPGAPALPVSVVGMRGVIVVCSREGVLVVPKDRAQDVRQAVAELRRRGAARV
ncbi:MAG: Mannose-1-phosphate guanylyltransferase RfbM [Lentisphaerae bacterium ADurb.BinA184]|nr:MAG: Mannose-1-phosphate guanylyltransferase RfbM [Lentisphaerae bacterium ADurb.BinA184]